MWDSIIPNTNSATFTVNIIWNGVAARFVHMKVPERQIL